MMISHSKTKIICTILSSCFLLSACGRSKTTTNSFQIITSNKIIEQELVAAATNVERYMQTLAASQKIVDPNLLDIRPLITPEGGLSGQVSIDWSGPIEPILYKIAVLGDYQVKIFGKKPPIPVMISLSENQASLADLIKNMDLQANNKAKLAVFPEYRVIELRYVS